MTNDFVTRTKKTLNGVFHHLNIEVLSENITMHIDGKLQNHLFGNKNRGNCKI